MCAGYAPVAVWHVAVVAGLYYKDLTAICLCKHLFCMGKWRNGIFKAWINGKQRRRDGLWVPEFAANTNYCAHGVFALSKGSHDKPRACAGTNKRHVVALTVGGVNNLYQAFCLMGKSLVGICPAWHEIIGPHTPWEPPQAYRTALQDCVAVEPVGQSWHVDNVVGGFHFSSLA